jgi:hypothetical protein
MSDQAKDQTALDQEALLGETKQTLAARRMDAVTGRYRELCYGQPDGEPDETMLYDLLTDLRHWCVVEKVDFETALYHSIGHWSDETEFTDYGKAKIL